MIFVSDSILEARRKLVQQMEAGELTREESFQRALELDPFDALALIVMADERFKAGDLEAAAECSWRAAGADPCRYEPWFKLHASLRGESPALLDGILELAAIKTLRSPQGIADFDESFKNTREAAQFPGGAEALEIMASQLGEKRRDEPGEVGQRLKPYRLVDEVLDANAGMDEELVDEILQEGPRCGPLLVGVLRAMAGGSLPGGDPAPIIASLALLGEIGDPAVVPELIECFSVNDEEISEAARWAMARIASRRPEQAFDAVRRLAAGADAGERCILAIAVRQIPEQPDRREFLVGLLDGLSAAAKSDRHELFMVVADVLLSSPDSNVEELAWQLFDRYAALLPKRTRATLREAAQARHALAKNGYDFPIESADVTVYDLCCGEDEEDAEVENGEEGDDDYPEPVRRSVTLGRNDPCWCGSGKKYKKCHLESDSETLQPKTRPEAAPPAATNPAEAALRRRLIDFSTETLRRRGMEEAMLAFFGSEPPAGGDDDSLALESVDWLTHDYIPPRLGHSLIEEFLKRNPGGLNMRERRLLESWSRSHYSLFEAQEVRQGSGVLLKDLLAGGEFFVHDVSTARRAALWDVYLARVEELDGRYEFTATVLTIPRQMVAPLKEWAMESREKSGLDWDVFLRGHSHRLRQEASRLINRSGNIEKLVSAEGDELVFSNARYEILDEDALRRALDGSKALVRCNDAGDYDWLDEEEDSTGGRRVFGHLRIAGNRLTLECTTRQRLERGRDLLRNLAGPALQHKGDDFTGWRAAMRDRPPSADAPRPVPQGIEREILDQMITAHYQKWPDTPLPALGGKTPRQAVASSRGHAAVIDLLKLIENGEDRKRRDGRAWYDVSKLKTELGVEF